MNISRLIPLLPGTMMALVATVALAGIASTGAPQSSTGAPGERNCTASGCHDDNPVNAGPGSISLRIGDGSITRYEPGKVYPVTVSITQDRLVRFGFQAVTIADKDGKSAGTLQTNDPSRTQVFYGDVFFPERQYVTYTYQGTSALATGSTQWTFNWTAPDNSTGPVSFYLAAVAANNDGTDKGDMAYTISAHLTPSGSAAVDDRYPVTSRHLQPDLR